MHVNWAQKFGSSLLSLAKMKEYKDMCIFYTFETLVNSELLKTSWLQNYMGLQNHRLIPSKLQQSPQEGRTHLTYT